MGLFFHWQAPDLYNRRYPVFGAGRVSLIQLHMKSWSLDNLLAFRSTKKSYDPLRRHFLRMPEMEMKFLLLQPWSTLWFTLLSQRLGDDCISFSHCQVSFSYFIIYFPFRNPVFLSLKHFPPLEFQSYISLFFFSFPRLSAVASDHNRSRCNIFTFTSHWVFYWK